MSPPKKYFFAVLLILLAIFAPYQEDAIAQEPNIVHPLPVTNNLDTQGIAGTPAPLLGRAFDVLLQLLVLATFLESALALLFNWRPFMAYFDGQGVKSLVALGLSLLLVLQFNIDAFTPLLGHSGPAPYGVASLLTAMVIAGGSAAVNNMLRRLGFRSMLKEDDIRRKPPLTQAWLSVSFNKREQSIGAVQVEIKEGAQPYAVAGTIHQTASTLTGRRLFMRDRGRLPTSQGLPLIPGVCYSVRLKGVNKDGAIIHSPQIWSAEGLRPGALVDIELSL